MGRPPARGLDVHQHAKSLLLEGCRLYEQGDAQVERVVHLNRSHERAGLLGAELHFTWLRVVDKLRGLLEDDGGHVELLVQMVEGLEHKLRVRLVGLAAIQCLQVHQTSLLLHHLYDNAVDAAIRVRLALRRMDHEGALETADQQLNLLHDRLLYGRDPFVPLGLVLCALVLKALECFEVLVVVFFGEVSLLHLSVQVEKLALGALVRQKAVEMLDDFFYRFKLAVDLVDHLLKLGDLGQHQRVQLLQVFKSAELLHVSLKSQRLLLDLLCKNGCVLHSTLLLLLNLQADRLESV
jgi:hypothetical protein